MSDNEGAESEAGAATVEESGEADVEDDERVEGVDEELVEDVEAADPEQLAQEIATLREQRDALEDDLAAAEERADDLESKLKRERADFQNYKKRQEERREQVEERATEDLVERLLDVRDNLQRAVDQDEDIDIREGVSSTLDQFDRVLADENVERIEPAAGEEVDPQRHEVLTTVDADQPEGCIADIYRPGYEMAGRVIRPAQVTVSDG